MRRSLLLAMVALTITASTVVPVAATSTNAYDARPTTASVTGEQHSIETDATRGNLTATDYEVHDREVESGERLRMSVVLRGEGTGPAATDLVVTVDGERKSLGRVTVEPGDGDVVVEPTALATDDGWDVECEIGYDDEDGFYIRCTISYEWPESDDGTHDVAVNDLEPTTVTVDDGDDSDRGNLTATGYEVHDREISPGEELRMNVFLEGRGTDSAATDLTVAIDGERETLARVMAEPGDGDVVVEPTALATDDGWDVECEIGYDDEDGFYIRCTISYEWPESDDGTHDVAVNDLEPTAITIEGGDGNDGDRAPENENEQSDDDRHDEEREDTADDGDQGDADDAPEMDIGSQEPWPCFPGGPGPTFPGGPRIPCPFPIPIPV